MRKRRTFVSRMLALLLAAAMIVTGAPVTTLAAVQEGHFIRTGRC